MIERLQKLIARSGLASRRHAEAMIAAGRVRLNGRVARLGDRADPERDEILVDGVPLPVAPGLVTYLLAKPRGVVSTAADPEGRPTVVELVPAHPRVFPVGRLDTDSEGLILLTNDGDLALRVTHPRYGVEKTYVAWVAGRPGRRTLARLMAGVELEDGVARAIRARVLDALGEEAMVEVVVGEGRNREVRRLLAAVGYPVRRLVRTAIGPVRDRRLRPGGWRRLEITEIRALYAAAGETREVP